MQPGPAGPDAASLLILGRIRRITSEERGHDDRFLDLGLGAARRSIDEVPEVAPDMSAVAAVAGLDSVVGVVGPDESIARVVRRRQLRSS